MPSPPPAPPPPDTCLDLVAADAETHPIQKGNLTPRPVCWAFDGGTGTRHLMESRAGLAYLRDCLRDPRVRLVGHNFSFDLVDAAAHAPSMIGEDIMPDIFSAQDACRVEDTMIDQQLHDLGDGVLDVRRNDFKFQTYGLDSLAEEFLDLKLVKGEEGFQLRYGDFDGVPIDQWPEGARRYPCDDTTATRRLHVYQRARWGVPATIHEQVRTDFALQLMSAWGVRTDPVAVRALERRQDKVILDVAQELAGKGWLDGVKKKEGAIREAVRQDWIATKGGTDEMPLTEGGAPAIGAEDLRACQDPGLRRLADLVEALWIKSNPCKALAEGADRPITSRYAVLKKTGRMGSSGPNMHNWKRTGGVRECIIPRPGCVFVCSDYATVELRAFAQDLLDLFGPTSMTRALMADKDLHVDLAAEFLALTYDQANAWFEHKGTDAEYERIKEQRQFAKPVNFGLLGCMGAAGLVLYAAGSGVKMTLLQAQNAIEVYKRKFPEVHGLYFPFITAQIGQNGYGKFTHPVSGLRVGRSSMPEMANARFQGRVAHGVKRALYEVSYRSYVKRSSWLYGSRLVVVPHDELVMEAPEEIAHEVAMEMEQVMHDQMKTMIPDIPIKLETTIARRYSKKAKPVWTQHGNTRRLSVCEIPGYT